MISAVVLTSEFNPHLENCLKSLHFCDEIIAIDDNSDSQTLKILKKYHTKIYPHLLNSDFSDQRNFGLNKALNPWVLFVDSDEVVSPELSDKIINTIQSNDYTGYYLHRIDTIYGKTLLHGDVGDVWILRLARKEAGAWINHVHEIWQIDGLTSKLKGNLDHYPLNSLAQFITKLNHYSSIRAGELFSSKQSANLITIILYPTAKFFHLWLAKLGFLDGSLGLIHALLMSLYSFLVRGKLYLLSIGIN
jgi:glycosyltransferase involved in cell wall biosynthesis